MAGRRRAATKKKKSRNDSERQPDKDPRRRIPTTPEPIARGSKKIKGDGLLGLTKASVNANAAITLTSGGSARR